MENSFFQNLASTAESGWDFSTRWFKDHLNLSTVETTNIVPVDLNAILCWNMNLMEYLANEAGKYADLREISVDQTHGSWK